MTIDQIIGFVRAESLTITLKQGRPSITGGTPSSALLKILKEHRDDVIKGVEDGLFGVEIPDPEPARCDDCKSWVFDTKDAARLCDYAKCPFK
jgi:hypothetical protein